MTHQGRRPEQEAYSHRIVGWCLTGFLMCALAAGFTNCHASALDAPVTFHRKGLTNAQCMAHDPHWSTVVTYWGDTTMTWVGHADTACSITGPVGGVSIGGGGKP